LIEQQHLTLWTPTCFWAYIYRGIPRGANKVSNKTYREKWNTLLIWYNFARCLALPR